MAKLRKIDDELEARVLLAKVDAAGGDIGAWSRAHGVDGRSLHAWQMNLARGVSRRRSRRRAGPASSTLRLVELVPSEMPLAKSSRYTVQIGTVTVELDDDFREDTLKRLIKALRTC